MNGAHLGWICGVFGFVVVTVFLAATAVMLSDPANRYRPVRASATLARDSGFPQAEQMLNIFHTPSGLSTALADVFRSVHRSSAFSGAIEAGFSIGKDPACSNGATAREREGMLPHGHAHEYDHHARRSSTNRTARGETTSPERLQR